MNANELADKLEGTAKFINNISNQYHAVREVKEAATMLRAQQAEIEALKNLVAEQDKKIIDLAFKLVYAERSNEIVKELSK